MQARRSSAESPHPSAGSVAGLTVVIRL